MDIDVSNLLPGIPLVESPLFPALVETGAFRSEEIDIARQLHDQGFAVIDFPDPEIGMRIDRVKAWIAKVFQMDLADPQVVAGGGDLRLQDGWKENDDIAAIAANPEILALLGRLYGRRAFPFQTLNFPVGTQQHAHSDTVHFSSLPERFMCGVWLAFEDVRAEAGPLEYYPGSHRWPSLSNVLIGRRGWGSTSASAQHPFECAWQAMIKASKAGPEMFLARKGQALIWTANLLHGGRPRDDRTLSRWSQVTHYYFDDCIYYTPAYSDELLYHLDLRTMTDISTGVTKRSSYLGAAVSVARPAGAGTLLGRAARALQRALRGARSI